MATEKKPAMYVIINRAVSATETYREALAERMTLNPDADTSANDARLDWAIREYCIAVEAWLSLLPEGPAVAVRLEVAHWHHLFRQQKDQQP